MKAQRCSGKADAGTKRNLMISCSWTYRLLHICPLPVPAQSASHVCSPICRGGTCSCLISGEEKMNTKVSDLDVKELWLFNRRLWYFNGTTLRHTSKATEPCLLIVFADVRLVVPPYCGSQVVRGSDWSFPVDKIYVSRILHFSIDRYFWKLVLNMSRHSSHLTIPEEALPIVVSFGLMNFW